MTDKKKDKTASHSVAGDAAASGAGSMSYDELDVLMKASGVLLKPEASASQARPRAADDILLEALFEVEAEYEACAPRAEGPMKKREAGKVARSGAKAAEAAVDSASADPFASGDSPAAAPACAPRSASSADDLITESLASAKEEAAEEAPRVKSPAKRRSRKASASRVTSGVAAAQAPSDGAVPCDSEDAGGTISSAKTSKDSSAEVAEATASAATQTAVRPRIRRVSSPAKKTKIFGFSAAPETLDAFDDPDDPDDLSLKDLDEPDAPASQDPLAQVMAEIAEEEEDQAPGYIALDDHLNTVWKERGPEPADPVAEVAKAMMKKGEFAPSAATSPASPAAASPDATPAPKSDASSAPEPPRKRRPSSRAKKGKACGFSEFPESSEALDDFDDPDDLSLKDLDELDAPVSQDPLAQVVAEMAEEEEDPMPGYFALDEHLNSVWRECEPEPDPIADIAKAMVKKGEFAPSAAASPAVPPAAPPAAPSGAARAAQSASSAAPRSRRRPASRSDSLPANKAPTSAAASSASSGSGSLSKGRAASGPKAVSATGPASTVSTASAANAAGAAGGDQPAESIKASKSSKARAARSASAATAPVGSRETLVASKEVFDEYSVKPGKHKELSDSVREKVEALADITKLSTPHLEKFEYAKTPLSRVMMIEASAGTGKTYALERLVLRFIVEKEVPIESFLIVTFTKAATGELKERVRAILKSAQAALRAAALESPGLFDASDAEDAGAEMNGADSADSADAEEAGLDEEGADGVDDGTDDADALQPASRIHFADESLEKLWVLWVKKGVARKALSRITAALEEFDRCAIFTIHSFCQKMLQAWAFSSGADFDTEVGDDRAILEGAFDAFKRYWLSSPDFAGDAEAQKKLIDLDCGTLLEGLLLHPGAWPSLAFPDAAPPMTQALEDFASRIPGEIDAAKRRAGVMNFNDMLARMAKAVSESPEFRANVGAQFHAVLVDEFQDTDSLQYRIFKALFLDKEPQGFKGAVFVGDPKQSIYKFRGAEIGVYLRAREAIALRRGGKILTLKTNYRTTPPVVDSVTALFKGDDERPRFGAGIDCPVVESKASLYPLFQKDPETGALAPLSAFELWTSDWDDGGRHCDGDIWISEHYTQVEDRREAEAEMVANDIASLLSSETYVGKRLAAPGVPLFEARLKPGDIAILVKKHADADLVQKALFDRGVRCIHAKKDDVFATEEARDILAILKALADPGDRRSVNAARATPAVGRRLKDIALTGDESADAALNGLYLEDLKRFREASERCRRAGPAAAIERLFASFDTVGRVLGKKGGERLLTNWTHIAELLSAAYGRLKTLPSLISWYEAEVVRAFAAPGKDAQDERALRVESDESLVRIETVYASKGLEYPVVYAIGAGDADVSLKKGPAFVQRDVAALIDGRIPGEGPIGVGGHAYYLGLDAKEPDGKAELAALEAELARIAYVWATRASARFVLPLLPNYKKGTRSKKDGASSFSFSNTGNVWMRLLAGDVKAADPWAGRKPGEKAVAGAIVASRIKFALEGLKKRLVNHSTFLMKSDPAKGKRFAMADALEEAAADLPAPDAPHADARAAGTSGASLSDPWQEKCALLLEAASALRRLPGDEALAHVRFLSKPAIEAMPLRMLAAGRAPEAGASASRSLAPVALLQAGPVPSAWRSSSYSSITRGFEVVEGAAEAAAGADDLSGGREGDESYETESIAAPYAAPRLRAASECGRCCGLEQDSGSAFAGDREGASEPPEPIPALDARSLADAGGAAEPRLDPAFLAGGKDTGDAVHNLFEACVQAGLHRAPQKLRAPEEEEGAGSDAGGDAPRGDAFLSVFNRTPGARLLFGKVRHPGAAPGRQPDDEDRRLALLWIRDRIRGTFETDWLGGKNGGLRLSESPEGCASAELAFSMRVKTGLPPDEFARRMLALNEKLPKAARLPLAEFKSDSGRHPLKGFLEGRIDLLFQAKDGRFWLADWKTDQPGAAGRRSYAAKAMREVMVREKYGWQALFYLVALVRLLREAYGETGEEAFERIGGMAYVFVRGFSHAFPAKEPAAVILKPAAELVLAADALLESEEK